MTPKQIRYTHHAVEEMRKARITRGMVRSVLAVGERRVKLQLPTGVQWAKTAVVDGRPIEVVYFESARVVRVVTLYVAGLYD